MTPISVAEQAENPKSSVYDFSLYQKTVGSDVAASIGIDADLGYLGIDTLHPNSRIPKKASTYHKLTKRGRDYHTRLSRKRVIIEHINAKIKTFKIMSYPYRNHCQRHLLRMSLILWHY
jgi:hypothetical protein